jgi:hypothetical protein
MMKWSMLGLALHLSWLATGRMKMTFEESSHTIHSGCIKPEQPNRKRKERKFRVEGTSWECACFM